MVGLAGCSTTPLNPAPIVDRSERAAAAPRAEQAPARAAPAPPSAAPREARAGVYTVQRGDTLYSVALAFGLDYRDLARWNGIEDPSRLTVGQTLRVEPPAATAVVAPVAPVAAAQATPLPPASPAASAASPAGGPSAGAPAPAAAAAGTATAPSAAAGGAAAASAGGAAAVAPAAAASAPAAASSAPTEAALLGQWIWPADGRLLEGFHETRNKGIDIAGKEGDPVVAAADGQVVYSGSGLRGYGNLVILKHGEEFISAYAHNRQILVKQGQSVRRGQRIAELGRSDAEVPKLHFEIRRQGKPVDPLSVLPSR